MSDTVLPTNNSRAFTIDGISIREIIFVKTRHPVTGKKRRLKVLKVVDMDLGDYEWIR